MTENNMHKALDSLHKKILNSKFAEEVTEQEILALVEAKEIRAKAIDEFAERLKPIIDEKIRGWTNSDNLRRWCENSIEEVAEQMKAGVENEK